MDSSQTIGFDENRFPGLVNPDFKCGICFGVVNDPVKCNNEGAHLFCKCCLEVWYESNPTCPVCQTKAKGTKRNPIADTPDFIVRKMIKDLDIKCRFNERGCFYVVKLGVVDEHEKICDFNHSDVVAEKIETMRIDIANKDKIIEKLTLELEEAEEEFAETLAKNEKTIRKLRHDLSAIVRRKDKVPDVTTKRRIFISSQSSMSSDDGKKKQKHKQLNKKLYM